LHHFGLLIYEEAASGSLGSSLMAACLARALAVHLLRHHSSRTGQVRTPWPTLNTRHLNTVVDYMRTHFDEPIFLQQLAELCGLSATHFTRAFREATGKPPHAFIIDLRLERARDLLERTSLSITEIAFACGFQQSQYFATMFRLKLGCTPSEWRRRQWRV
jgi:AraC family transcriptional regulator